MIWVNTVKEFWQHPYLAESTAIVAGIYGSRVTLDRTIAFAFSGGQESDFGTIGGQAIVAAEKQGKVIFYTLPEDHNLSVGDTVVVKIDWERRYKIMKLHFAAEIILELVTQTFADAVKIGAHIGPEKARLDFAWNGSIAEVFPFLSSEAGRIIAADFAIASDFEDEANEIRFWRIDDFATVRCGGTHIKRTGEIGGIMLRRNNIGKGKERIEITLRNS